MAENKTVYTDENVEEFIHSYANSEKKIQDSFRLVEWMKEASGEEPRMYGSSIIGFGNYHYKYESGREGNAPLIGFSPRKSAISLYVTCGNTPQEDLDKLGKFKRAKACIYIQKIEDINPKVLMKIMKDSIQFTQTKYPSL